MRALTILSAIALLAYPLAVYYGLSQWGLGVVAGLLAFLFLLRIIAGNQTRLRELKYVAWLSGATGIVLTLLGTVFQQEGWFTFYPVVVNTLMFGLFSMSLWQKETLVERLARLQEPNLPASGVRYTRKVTKVWCAFFVINGSIALYTCFQPLAVWTLYNGLISYLAAGTLFIVEFIVRFFVREDVEPHNNQQQNDKKNG
ncbi:COG4648 family protein [Photobacterium swingsii]|uniref:DNA gyrase subunit B n=1 Tax=Photobacterium swingsii TaxID=680026 RepID=A0A0J8VAZ4_9GAMM|nr:hypothetical protein [Photobacterium swingsii]KMV29745.1 DNA gyrase subunit B [Photobacterium swingsii]PSW22869.1 DNA gyrase subunit B [Photobacterium swingsii]